MKRALVSPAHAEEDKTALIGLARPPSGNESSEHVPNGSKLKGKNSDILSMATLVSDGDTDVKVLFDKINGDSDWAIAAVGHEHILAISDEQGLTVAHHAAKNAAAALALASNASTRILRLADGDGWTVAHQLATDPKSASALVSHIKGHILRLRGGRPGITVADVASRHSEAALRLMERPKYMKIASSSNWTVAHTAARHHEVAMKLLEHPDILTIPTDSGWTVAHEIAMRHTPAAFQLTRDLGIATLTDRKGRTVANMVKRANTLWNSDPIGTDIIESMLIGLEVRLNSGLKSSVRI